jgi:hypothetical protein
VEELENDGFGSCIGGIGAFGEESGHRANTRLEEIQKRTTNAPIFFFIFYFCHSTLMFKLNQLPAMPLQLNHQLVSLNSSTTYGANKDQRRIY